MNVDEKKEWAPHFSLMQAVKRKMFAMRNGVLADQMRRAGLQYRVNFGLNLPQIKDIALWIVDMNISTMELTRLATDLWNNEHTRESRLLAPMIYPAEIIPCELARQWLLEAQTVEVVDCLCHSLLRHLPFAEQMARQMFDEPETSVGLHRYAALRLLLNLAMSGKIDVRELRPFVANIDTEDIAYRLSRQILDEIAFADEL